MNARAAQSLHKGVVKGSLNHFSPNWSDERRILKWLFDNPQGGAPEEIALGTDIHPKRVISIIKWRLEPEGEVYLQGERWRLTALALAMRDDPKVVMEQTRKFVRSELERAIFEAEPPPWVHELVAAVKKFDMGEMEAWHFAKRKFAEGVGKRGSSREEGRGTPTLPVEAAT